MIVTMFKRTIIFQWLTAALALAPAAGYAYLGQFSRMMSDDYCQIALGKEMGAWDYMIYKFNTWAGSYANWFFKGAMAPLDTLLPRVMPALIILLWLVGMSWLVFQRLAHLKIEKPRWALSVMIAALAVAAGIHAFYSPQSFYWYAASTHYTLPLALLTIYLALVFWLAQRPRPSWWAVIAGGALCFITAGAAEMFTVFQAVFLTLCLLASFAFLRPSVRRPYALVFGIGWLATLMGLVIQLSSPGVYLRAASIVEAYGQPNRGLSAILSETLSRSLGYIEDPQVLAGLIMLMGVGLLVMLIHCEPQAALGTSKPVKLALPPLWLGLMVQLIFVPILWLHTSDHPQLLGRFSVRYMTAIMLNIVFLLGFLVLLWRRNRINIELQKRGHGLLIVGCAAASMFAVVLLAFIRTQDMHSRASAYLTASFLVFLGMIIWQLLPAPQTTSARKIGLLALFVYAAAAVCIAAVVGAALFGRGGFVAARTLAPGAYLLNQWC